MDSRIARPVIGAAKIVVPPPPIEFKTLADFCREYVPLDYSIEGLLRTSSLYTLTARTGHGKTAFLVAIAFAVETGRPDILGVEAKRGRVAYLTFENPDDVRMRLMAAAYLFNVDIDEISDRIVILDCRIKPEDVIAKIKILADQVPFTLVLVDTFAAFFDGNDTNDATQAGEFTRRMRPLTKLKGLPTVVVACHPVKNASEENLLPYGSGAILNEVDGNLPLWKNAQTGIISLHWQGKIRGPDFEPRPFRLEGVCSPDLVDAKGKQFEIPVLRPADAEAAEHRERSNADTSRELLAAMVQDPGSTQAELARVIGKPRSTIHGQLHKLRKLKLADETLGKWRATRKGKEALK